MLAPPAPLNHYSFLEQASRTPLGCGEEISRDPLASYEVRAFLTAVAFSSIPNEDRAAQQQCRLPAVLTGSLYLGGRSGTRTVLRKN